MKTQFLVLLSARVFATGMQALTFILLARWAGVRDFGIVAVIAGVGAVLFTVADWGLSSYIPRARAKGRDAEVATGLKMDLIGNAAAGSFAALVLTAVAATTGLNPWFILVPVALALEQFVEVGLTVPIADKAKAPLVISLVLRRITSFGLFVSLYALGFETIAAYSLGMITASVVGIAHVLRVLHQRLAGRARAASAREMYKFLIPYFLANLSSQARTLDSAIVGAASSVASAGLYSAAFRLINPLMLVSGSIVAVVLPHASRQGLPEAKKLGQKLSLAALLASLPLIPVIIWSPAIVELLFGSEFAAAAPAFAFAVAALPFLSLAPPLGGLLQSQGLEAFVATNGIIFAVLNLGGVLLGALLWGPAGAAAGVAIVYSAKSLVLFGRLQTAKATLIMVPSQSRLAPSGTV
ncbi:oligosaccharide flippase family protein [Arthrobacter sp. AL08]|uniref:lipopolysaccharide biosynthesis protein n=1 Tax=unclassified Arthrobacter TaxID=235627 RepID=UPI00249A78DA|nr:MULTISPECIES: oligosaccharide flippase family protein [unclassified Arthrobacter]MDI3240571.1 oligosaccharide flippase family protein [Arthrobacter sp. AL05]MDI3276581.1 oligosaccharide flippase family protein [Arthrobacter sp. AL08]